MVHDPTSIDKLFPEASYKFIRSTSRFFKNSGGTKRSNRTMYPFKAQLLVTNLAKSLIAEGHPVFYCVLDIPEECLQKALAEVNPR